MEPSADLRASANAMRQMFIALTNEGFTSQEALVIIGTIIAVGIQKGDAS